LDPKRTRARGAKVDLLVSRLQELVGEGHRAVVFSQFTRFLAIVREHLRAEGIATEYLDGKTRDRQGVVERFQSGAGAPVFLISIKAGGVGLNLTAADSVFLLDPWWNPAVEAQAVDRAWRIGQTRRVFAYRLIARDTVEERVAALQRNKQRLTEALLCADKDAIRGLSRDDFDLLLS
ncbi:MAG: SWF/SNF helicase family protein, partial [Planctomycetaceae bacterium]|nr:SWF/SNF helicase family protein [Planctomycetaceae bacterium]